MGEINQERFMFKYIVQTEKMNEIMGLLYRILDIRITFFDLKESELDYFDIKQMSPFCRYYRNSDSSFNDKCVKCDRKNLLTAKRTGNAHVYHCHSGLLEGIVPLYDKHKTYLGAIVFGQLCDKDKKYPASPAKNAKLLRQTRLMTKQEVCDIGKLLKHIGEYIIENEIIRRRNKPWTELLEDYISEHICEKLTLGKAAKQISRSSSFVSQNFPKEFGMPFKSYILKMKMERAMKMLESGCSVKQTASELGFYDEFHFSKGFKKYFGQAPSFKIMEK